MSNFRVICGKLIMTITQTLGEKSSGDSMRPPTLWILVIRIIWDGGVAFRPILIQQWRGSTVEISENPNRPIFQTSSTWKTFFFSIAGKTYFFKDKLFWKFDNLLIKIDKRYPLPAPQYWLGCPERLDTVWWWKLNTRLSEISGASRLSKVLCDSCSQKSIFIRFHTNFTQHVQVSSMLKHEFTL